MRRIHAQFSVMELAMTLSGLDGEALGVNPAVQRAFDSTVQSAMAELAEVPSHAVHLSSVRPISDGGVRLEAKVRTPAGRTAGDVRGRLTEERLGPAVAKALGSQTSLRPFTLGAIAVSGMEVFFASSKHPSTTTASTTLRDVASQESGDSLGEAQMMYVVLVDMQVQDLEKFDGAEFLQAFAHEVDVPRSRVTTVQTQFQTKVRYLVPAWVTPSSLQPVLAAAVGAPLKAVEVFASSRRLSEGAVAQHILAAVVSTEDPSMAAQLAEELRDPKKVEKAAEAQGIASPPLQLEQAPSVAVKLHTLLDLPRDVLSAPTPKHLSAELRHRLGVEATADVLGVREVIEQRWRPDEMPKPQASVVPATTRATTHVTTQATTTTTTTTTATVATTTKKENLKEAPYGTGEDLTMYVIQVEMSLKDLVRFDGTKFIAAFAHEVHAPRSRITTVQTQYQAKVRYLVPTWLAPSSLQPMLVAALGAPPKAVEVTLGSSRRLAEDEAAEHVLSAVVSTEAASTAVKLAQELRDPTKVLDAAATQGVPSFELKLQEAPSVAVQLKTMLDLPDDVLAAPMPKHLSAELSKRLGVEATADVLGVREVIEQRRRPDVATKEKAPTSPKGLGSLFHIRAGRISINNLGGVRSSKEPEELRYSHVASAFGKELDLVVRAVGSYKPRDPALTGIDGHVFAAAINVANDGDVQLEVSVVEKDSNKLVHLPQCHVSVFDIEDPLPTLSASGQVEVLGAKVMFWRNGTAVPMKEPWAPQGPAAWYPVGEDGAVRLRIRAERSGGNALSSAWVGRNFFIALRSPAVTVQEEIDAPARGSHEAVAQAAWKRLGRKLLLGRDNVIFNNLGGQGPGHLDEPPEIRYAAVGSVGGDNVDMAQCWEKISKSRKYRE
ncbi:unnamed protein product [Symbiodinium sp. CCMP2592]|nr:unnamed protein product [Symbiodinium sp. CCMP2592]